MFVRGMQSGECKFAGLLEMNTNQPSFVCIDSMNKRVGAAAGCGILQMSGRKAWILIYGPCHKLRSELGHDQCRPSF